MPPRISRQSPSFIHTVLQNDGDDAILGETYGKKKKKPRTKKQSTYIRYKRAMHGL